MDSKTQQPKPPPETSNQVAEEASQLSKLLARAGVVVNGNFPWDPQIHDTRFYQRVYRQGSVGAGESYLDGWWDCEHLDQMFYRILSAQLEEHFIGRWIAVKYWLQNHLLNPQSRQRAFQLGRKHYDIGNDLFELMLDPSMTYSCGYWHKASNLVDAQRDKHDLICQKLHLQTGETLLDVGCGWGSLAEFAARNYAVTVKGITISQQQQQLAQQRCQGLPVTISLQDYRDAEGQFDKMASIGMFEHVGSSNYAVFARKTFELLKTDGIFLLHTIGSDESTSGCDPWINQYIFPNGSLPSLSQISRACEPYFVIEDVHNFGQDYDRTLMSWFENFNQAWPQLSQKYSPRFYRMWCYYLLSCAGAFRSRTLQLYQIVLRKRRILLPRYHCPR